MIHKCRNCGMAVAFNPVTQMLECSSCGSRFYPSEFAEEAGDTVNTYTSNQADRMLSRAESQRMECRIYSCNACGAELIINDAEAATFCAYCGQPTIVFQRIGSSERPNGIIPFSVSRESAISIIKNRFKEGGFIPKEIKEFNIEKVRGVYIPFWLFDINYRANTYWSGEVGSGDDKTTKYFMRDASCSFKRLTQDASKNLLDESSQRLEPYDFNSLVPFDTGYLSGFYADRFDDSVEEVEARVKSRAREIFNSEIEKSIKASNRKLLYEMNSNNVLNSEYVLLPAWFFSFIYEGQKYTMLVNGQTGKLVGTVPADKKKSLSLFAFLSPVLSIVSIFLLWFLLPILLEDDWDALLYIFGGVFLVAGAALVKWQKYKKTMSYTTSASNDSFANNRQDI